MRATEKTVMGKCEYVSAYLEPYGYSVHWDGSNVSLRKLDSYYDIKTIAGGTKREIIWQLECFMDAFFLLQPFIEVR